ncbi:MAG: DUF111 family protein, partial [Gemmataceae bacterium]|nr:DUF111 family protein [Gemmataceae bacterium]
AIVFRETATFGIRRTTAARSKLAREFATVQTPWGPVRVKHGQNPELTIVTPEYEDCARLARERGVPLREVFDTVRRMANQ